MRGVLEADHFGHLQVDEAVDEVVVEHAADFQELAILVEIHESPARRFEPFLAPGQVGRERPNQGSLTAWISALAPNPRVLTNEM